MPYIADRSGPLSSPVDPLPVFGDFPFRCPPADVSRDVRQAFLDHSKEVYAELAGSEESLKLSLRVRAGLCEAVANHLNPGLILSKEQVELAIRLTADLADKYTTGRRPELLRQEGSSFFFLFPPQVLVEVLNFVHQCSSANKK